METMDATPRLALPVLQPGQAQKELWHNEALLVLDLLAGARVEGVGLDTPPPAPVPGQAWIVGEAPVGDWAGHARAVAGWSAGGWRFVAAIEGMVMWSAPDGLVARFAGGRWVTGGTVAAPDGGAVVDAEARASIADLRETLRLHGLIVG